MIGKTESMFIVRQLRLEPLSFTRFTFILVVNTKKNCSGVSYDELKKIETYARNLLCDAYL